MPLLLLYAMLSGMALLLPSVDTANFLGFLGDLLRRFSLDKSTGKVYNNIENIVELVEKYSSVGPNLSS